MAAVDLRGADPAYEQGLELVKQARQIKDREQLRAQLLRAAEKFEESIAGNPENAAAYMQLGMVHLEAARIGVKQAADELDAARKRSILRDCQAGFDRGCKSLDQAIEAFEQQLQDIPNVNDMINDAALARQRERPRRDHLQARLTAALAMSESASAFPAESEEARQRLTNAADRFSFIHERCENQMAGLYALMYQAKCLLDLKQYQQALAVCDEILEVAAADQPAFRQLRAKSLRTAMECWINPERKDYDEAIRRGEAFLAKLPDNGPHFPDDLAVRWMLVQALLAQQKSTASQELKEALSAKIKTQGELVATHRNEFNDEARALMEELTGNKYPPL